MDLWEVFNADLQTMPNLMEHLEITIILVCWVRQLGQTHTRPLQYKLRKVHAEFRPSASSTTSPTSPSIDVIVFSLTATSANTLSCK